MSAAISVVFEASVSRHSTGCTTFGEMRFNLTEGGLRVAAFWDGLMLGGKDLLVLPKGYWPRFGYTEFIVRGFLPLTALLHFSFNALLLCFLQAATEVGIFSLSLSCDLIGIGSVCWH